MSELIRWENLSKVNEKYFKNFYIELSNMEKTGLYTMGKNVEQLEHDIASYVGTKYAIACGNALDGLTLSIKSLNLPEKSEIIVPSNTFYASVLAILRNNMTPIFCEPDIDTFNIKAENIEKLITNKTKAILVVHLYGNMCDMDAINELAKKHNLYVIEDSAQAFGAKYKDKMAGNLSDVGVFSFFPTKNLGGIGDAGMVVTNNEKIFNYIKLARNYGGEKYNYQIQGINSRMDEIQAIFLREKLKDIDNINNLKIRNANLYLQGINNNRIILPSTTKESKHVYYIFPIRCNKRDELKEYLLENGIEALIHYPIALNKMKVFEKMNISLKIAEKISATELSLPCSASHSVEEIKKIVSIINKFK